VDFHRKILEGYGWLIAIDQFFQLDIATGPQTLAAKK
jgi:hypothetical protein